MSRNGSVLGKKTVLKSDHFPGCQNKKIRPHVDGAPNFRQVRGRGTNPAVDLLGRQRLTRVRAGSAGKNGRAESSHRKGRMMTV